MAATDYPVNHPMAVKTWQADLFKEALKRTHAIQFMGKGTDTLIQIKTELGKGPGDKVTFGLRNQLTGGGVQGDGTLEGNEEALEVYTDSLVIDQLRHAVRSAGKMSEQRVPFMIRSEARDGLADWWADRIDTWFFNQVCGNTAQADTRYTGNQATIAPDAGHIVIEPGSANEAALSATTTQRMNLTLIDYAVEKGKLAQNQLRPIMVGGKAHWCLFMHPTQVTALRTNTAAGQWVDIQKAAMTGGKTGDNPIFTGALGVYNNVVLHESTRIPVSPNNANARRAVLCGAQAASVAFGRGSGKGVYSWDEELFDYKNQLGVAAGCIAGLKKNQFNGSDFATVVLPTYATAVA